MTRPLPKEQREKIVAAYQGKLGTAKEIAAIFNVQARSVYRYVEQYRKTGDLTPQPLPGRPPILTDKNLAIINNIVLANSDSTLEDYKKSFYKQTNIDVTIVTIHNACKILDLRRKKKASLQKSKEEKMFKKNE